MNSRTLVIHKGKYKWEVTEIARPVGGTMYLATRHGGRSKQPLFPRVFSSSGELLAHYTSVFFILRRHLDNQKWTGLREIWVSPEGVERLL